MKKVTTARPFTTDYGLTKGHCATKESCLIAAFKSMVTHRLSHVTLEGPNGKAIARLRRHGNGFFGIFIEVPGQGLKLVAGTESKELRRVK